jgi:hypothetical protein
MFSQIICPVSSKKVDSHISRLTVFMNAVLMICFLFSLEPIFLVVVVIDYGIRAFGYNQYSPLCFLSSLVIKLIRTQPKMTDKSPKVFASRLGFICAVMGWVFVIYGMPVASRLIIGFFEILAILDSVFNFCVGCLIYNYLVFPFFEKKISIK